MKEKDNNKKKSNDVLYEEISIPEGFEVEVNDFITISKDGKKLKRKLISFLSIKKDDNKVILTANKKRKIEKKLFGTFSSHIKNMFRGFLEGFTYKLQIANVHFPMKVNYDKTNNSFIIKNFLGEKKDRIIKILPNVEVKIDNDIIELSSYDIEMAGQSATNIEKGTRVKNKDRRIYQDGIFIIEKPGRVYL